MTTKSGKPGFAALAAALRDSHDRLAATVNGLSPDQVTAMSYADEWSIAQVLSHLGSGAEIFIMFLDAGVVGDPAPGMEEFQAVWSRWDAKEPIDQVHDSITADRLFLDRLDALTEAERSGWRMSLFGAEQDLGGIARLRLGEHVLHTWDVAVTFDDQATVPPDAAALLVDGLDGLAARSGKPVEPALRLHLVTHDPDRAFSLVAGPDAVQLSPTGPDPADHDGSLHLPAEAFVRLVYGRLDADHTPDVHAQGVELDAVRAVFSGF
jgi:uncharacterized protein (TIGR03083 family)